MFYHFLKKSLFLFTLFAVLSPCLFAQTEGKATIDIDEELKIEDETDDDQVETGNIEDKEIVVEGDDEQLIDSGKKDTDLIDPADNNRKKWQEPEDKIIKKEKRGVKDVEKKAQIETRYGSYNSLGVDIYITKRDPYGVYMLEYRREKYDNEGFGKDTFANSDHSSDYLNMVSGYNFSETYKMLIKARYEDYQRGLQQNTSYGQQFKRGGFFEVENLIRPSEKQALNIGLNADYISSNAEENTLPESSAAFARIGADANWQYIWGMRNSLNIGSSFYYAENDTYTNETDSYYRSGDFFIKNTFPIYRDYVGEEKTQWQIDTTVGAQVFFAQSMEPVAGPVLSVDNFLGNWHSRLFIERKGYLPDMAENYLRMEYFQPFQYTKPATLSLAAWQNRFKFTDSQVFKVDVGYEYHEVFYNPVISAELLYSYETKIFRAPYAKVAWEQNITEELFFETGLRAEYQADNANLREPVSAFVSINYLSGKWDVSLEARFISERQAMGTGNPDEEKLVNYTMLNAMIRRNLNSTVSVFIKGENLANMKYQRVYPYKTSGMKLYGGLHIFI